jgi:N-carbamoylputrescine amidase
MRIVTVAATQMSCSDRIEENIKQAETLVLEAVVKGAQIVLLQELFETKYFCQKPIEAFYEFARPVSENLAIRHFQEIAKKYRIVLPISFYERDNNVFYNSLAMIDADGEILGVYRKSHIPDGAGYQEKFFFSPGDTGFMVFDTAYARIGCGICWDQWFPEAARCMTLQGAELLLYPTAIGSEPLEPDMDSRYHWQRVMQGHAGANLVPVIASNRIGEEVIEDSVIRFYGSSFIADHTGRLVAEMDDKTEGICTAQFDLDAVRSARRSWGVFRDRRPDLYRSILTLDGHTPADQ